MTGKTHNFVTRKRDISYSSLDHGITGKIFGIDIGSSAPLMEGDYLLFPGPSIAGLSRYKIASIKHRYDPKGAYKGTVVYCNWSDAEWEREYPFIRAALSAGVEAWDTPV